MGKHLCVIFLEWIGSIGWLDVSVYHLSCDAFASIATLGMTTNESKQYELFNPLAMVAQQMSLCKWIMDYLGVSTFSFTFANSFTDFQLRVPATTITSLVVTCTLRFCSFETVKSCNYHCLTLNDLHIATNINALLIFDFLIFHLAFQFSIAEQCDTAATAIYHYESHKIPTFAVFGRAILVSLCKTLNKPREKEQKEKRIQINKIQQRQQ